MTDDQIKQSRIKNCTTHSACDCLLDRIERQDKALKIRGDALEEMAKLPWHDSDIKSLMEWVNGRASNVIAESKKVLDE